VVVANIQARYLKTEVGKGFMGTVFDHELVGPKLIINSNQGMKVLVLAKGNTVNIP